MTRYLPERRRALATTLLAVLVGAASAAAQGPDLVYMAVAPDGAVLAERGADTAVNPASVVKVATSLWALEELGPDRRFPTRFALRGELDTATGRLDGDLLVLGGGDPDFHVDNAFLVAHELVALGLREVGGDLLVEPDFWIGWEGGSARRLEDEQARLQLMGGRLEEAWDPGLWTPATRRSWEEVAARRGLAAPAPLRIAGEVGRLDEAGDEVPAGARVALLHRSNPLIELLRRFGTYSNNDIERFERHLGPPSALADWLTERWDAEPGTIRLSTLSGLGVNRMSPRTMVRLLQDFQRSLERLDRPPRDVLPVSGCGPSTLESYPRVDSGPGARAVVAKTGTLTTTDGGVAVLAGYADAAAGRLVFAAAAPGAGSGLAAARDGLDRWLVGLAAAQGGFRPDACAAELPHSDARAELVAWPAEAGEETPEVGLVGDEQPRAATPEEAAGIGRGGARVLVAGSLVLAAVVAALVFWLRRRG